MKHILNAAKAIFSLVVLTFTSWQTYNLLQSVVGKADPITPVVGIALFAGGFVFWSNLYTRDKESTAVQHAAALGGAILCMLMDATGAALHLLVGGQTLVTVDQNIGWWVIGVIVLAAAINIGLLFVHETHSQTAIEQRRNATERHQEEDATGQRADLRHEYRQAEIEFERDVVKDTIRELKAQKRTIAQKLAKDRAHQAAANLLASMEADPTRYLSAAAPIAALPAAAQETPAIAAPEWPTTKMQAAAPAPATIAHAGGADGEQFDITTITDDADLWADDTGKTGHIEPAPAANILPINATTPAPKAQRPRTGRTTTPQE